MPTNFSISGHDFHNHGGDGINNFEALDQQQDIISIILNVSIDRIGNFWGYQRLENTNLLIDRFGQ